MTEAPKAGSLTADPIAGLEGVVVAHTALSDVDGQNGRLVLRGKPIEELAGKATFEEAVRHLWYSYIFSDLTTLLQAFGAARAEAFATVPVLEAAASGLSIYERMQVGLSALPLSQDRPHPISISAALPVFLAASFRLANGEMPIAPDPRLSMAEDLLTMMFGNTSDADHVAALDRYLVTILDHGLNASTFTARVIGSTEANLKQAVLGAMGALSGPLHGGAPGPVLDMIDAIGTPGNAEAWIGEALARKERLMGFGHRIYRTRDPRADVLKDGLKALATTTPKVKLAEDIETAALAALKKARPGRVLDTNVEFYTAVLLDAIGIDRRLFTPLFAVGRTPGWCAHVMEQQETGKLIRPASVYVGP
ncbi:citrate synthase/methylcitrate synthase [Roseibium denhamense]|uniref:Citrate synthase n=1 Tax=Roseibium denhamense TaxID=76305 RepID=A0ABY1PCG0_9HYPH|nr:citrate synthase/methylcitrate synthase [Roseibium denhamense]MTI04589.1 citrate synthase/methylcitrate synthase [Roseibium denhamense]SMP31138.1 citrate synthase [Roseibium denhamense]